MTGPRPVSVRTAWILLTLVVVVLGSNWTISKTGLNYIPPMHFAAARMLFGGLVLTLLAAYYRVLRLPKRADLPLIFGVGLLQMAAFLTLITIALQYVPAGRSAILAYTTSLWVVPLAVLLLHEQLTRIKSLGLLLGLIGVAILFNPLGFDWTQTQVLLGSGLLLLAALCWALAIVLVRGYRGVSSPLALCPWQFLVACSVIVPLALIMEDSSRIQPGWELGLILLYNGPLATAFAFWALVTLTQALPAITTSLATLAVPVLGTVVAAIFLGESITPTNMGGLALILLGVAVVSLADRRKANNPNNLDNPEKQTPTR